MSLQSGTRLGPYEILSPLGAGGMGEVYKARDTRLDRFVAVKVLPAHLADHPDSLARFEREAKAIAALNHPNILGIFDFATHGTTVCVVTELLEGEALRTCLQGGPLSPRKATDLAIQLARGLAAAHAKGIVHRDLKPDNLWLTQEGRLKILDFGLAKQVGPGPGSGPGSGSGDTEVLSQGPATERGMILGTLGYMSPEQVRAEAVDGRADLFSFGAVLFEMLTGKRAFAGATPADTLAAILKEEPADLSDASRPIPPGLRRILDHCLEKSPARRFQNAEDLAFALESLQGDFSSQSPALQPPAPGTQNPLPPRKAALPAWGLGALAGLLAGAGLVLAILLPRQAPRPGPVAVRLLTYTGHDSAPACSPDGRNIAFSSDRDGQPRIWLKQLKGGGEVALTTGSDNLPRFAPDGSSILFIRSEGARTALYRTTLLGTDPRRIAPDASSGDWSPRGDRIAFTRSTSLQDPMCHLLVIDVAGGEAKELARIPGSTALGPRWSPDGRRIALTNSYAQMGGSAGHVYVVEVATGKVREFGLASRYGAVTTPAWVSGEEFVYFQSESVTGNGTSVSPSRCYRQNAGTGKVEALFWAPTSGREMDLLPDGRVIFDGMSGRQNLREYALNGKSPPRWLTRGTINDRQPVFSRDGEWVTFSSNRSGNLDLWSISTRTGALRSLTDDAAEDWDPGFSPDGGHLLWSSNRSGVFEIWLANPDGTEARQLTQDGEDAENPTMTRDGQWVVYSSGNPGKPGIWRVHPDGSGAACVLSTPNLLLPEVSPDGQYAIVLQTLGLASTDLHVVRLADSKLLPFSIHLTTDRNYVVTPGRARWTPDGRHIIYVGQDSRGLFGVYQQDFDPERDTLATRRPIAGFDPGWITESLGLSPDGSRLVLSESERVFSVMVAEGGTGTTLARGKP